MSSLWCGCCRQKVLDNTEKVRQLLITKGVKFEDLWLWNEFWVPDKGDGFGRGRALHVTMMDEGGFFGVSDIVFPMDELIATLEKIL